MYDFRARVWSPELATFLQPDEFGFLGHSGTLWSWPGQNPYRWSDPSGRDAIGRFFGTVIGGIIGADIGAVGGAAVGGGTTWETGPGVVIGVTGGALAGTAAGAAVGGYYGGNAGDAIGDALGALASSASDDLRGLLGGLLAASSKPDPSVIRGIKELPDDATLTPEQADELEKNLDAILEKTLPEKAKRGHADDVKKLLETDKRFRFLDQVRGARDKIRDAFRKHGCG